MNREIILFVVYDHPRDYPDRWVVRKQIVKFGEFDATVTHDRVPVVVSETLDEARQSIPIEANNIGRMPGDDPVIYEVWI